MPWYESVEGFSDNTLHRNEINTVGLPDVVDCDDVRVIQRRRGLRFLHEATLSLRISDLVRWQDLDSNKAIKMGVPGLVNQTHPTFAELFDDPVVRDGLAEQKGEALRPRANMLGVRKGQVNGTRGL